MTDALVRWFHTPAQLFTGRYIYLAVLFAVLSVIAAIIGLRGVAGVSWAVARVFVFLFTILFILSLIL